MSRDIIERLNTFGVHPLFKRIALNMNQIEEYNPPPNPAKVTDSRYSGYIREFGGSCWELDALKPEIIDSLIRDEVTKYCDIKKLKRQASREADARKLLHKISMNWYEIEQNYSNK